MQTTPPRVLAASRGRAAELGHTLIELVAVMAVMGVVALVPATVLVESIKVYTRISPQLDAGYQARLATERMRREIRALGDKTKISIGSTSALTLTGLDNLVVTYALSGGSVKRNGDLLARGVTSLSFAYRTRDGQTASDVSDLALVEIDISVQTGADTYRLHTAVCPGFARFETDDDNFVGEAS